ncbi:hypothetical protein C8Q77DRAFT_1196027 [Trametes polyzona]|nr:hypothetical protein C8Q77DRAFT_1196027 [Trametes polyzona]
MSLPVNWIYEEFSLTAVDGNGRPGSRISYSCKVCETVAFPSRTHARKHAVTDRHRQRINSRRAPAAPWLEDAPSSEPEDTPRRRFVVPAGAHLNQGQLFRASGDVAHVSEPSPGPDGPDWEASLLAATARNPGTHTDDTVMFDVDATEGVYSRAYSDVPAGATSSDERDVQHTDLPESGEETDESIFGWEDSLPSSQSESEPEHPQDSNESDFDLDTEADTNAGFTPGQFAEGESTPLRSGRPRRSRYFPYPNMTWCVLDIMLNLPRHPISDELLKIFLWALKILGVRHVPSLKAFRKFQTKLQGTCVFQKDEKHVSVLGNHFVSNSVLKSIMLDMSNPRVRRYMVFYPEEPVNGSSELRHSWKWFLGLPDDQLTPMWAHHDVHYYVGEAAQLGNGEVVVPCRWFVCAGEMHMFYYRTIKRSDEDGSSYEVDASKRHRGPASLLTKNLPDLLRDHGPSCQGLPTPSGSRLRVRFPTMPECMMSEQLRRLSPDPLTPNKWRVRAGGRPCYAYFILLGGDDVSGNRSKTWNKHWCFYFCSAGLPLACLNQEYFVHFVSTSQHAGPLEQVAAISAQLRGVAETGLVCLNTSAEDGHCGECLVIPNLFVETGDGPWQSELSSHSGDSKPCRFCEVGGTVEERSSDSGFLSLMRTGCRRTPAGTLAQIQTDLALATKPRKGAEIERNQKKTGVMDSLAQNVIMDLVLHGKSLFEQKDDDGKRRYTNIEIEATLLVASHERLSQGTFVNALLGDQVFDPHKDTALGRLHLVLLGFTKYFWSASLPIGGGKKLSVKDRESVEEAEATLFALSQDGIGDRSLRPDYLLQFRGSLVGRHLHSVAQLAVFLFARLVDPILHAVWVSLSRLCALLFVQKIKNMPEYIRILKASIEEFYDTVCKYNPTWILYKNKFHYLAHVPEMIERFGVLGLVAEDRFEKFHGLWRHSSIFSNHHAASRDSASHFNSLDATKHILSGGIFDWEGQAVVAGRDVLSLLDANPQLGERLGFRTERTRQAGKAH